MHFLLYILIGALSGWLAGNIMKGHGFGFFGNLGVGILGGFLGGFLFSLLQVKAYGLIGSLITALVGALVLIWIVGKIKKS